MEDEPGHDGSHVAEDGTCCRGEAILPGEQSGIRMSQGEGSGNELEARNGRVTSAVQEVVGQVRVRAACVPEPASLLAESTGDHPRLPVASRTYAEAAKAQPSAVPIRGEGPPSLAPLAVPITAPFKGKDKAPADVLSGLSKKKAGAPFRATSYACEDEVILVGDEACEALFRRYIGSSDLHQLSIQQTFARAYLDAPAEILELWDGEKVWTFSLRPGVGSHSFFLRKKWGAFCSAHSIKQGDSVTICRRPACRVEDEDESHGSKARAAPSVPLAISVSRATPQLAKELEQGLSEARAMDPVANQMAVDRAKPGTASVEKVLTASDRNTSHLGVVQSMLHAFPTLPRDGSSGSTAPLVLWRGYQRYTMKFTFSRSRKLHILHGEWGELVRAARLDEGDVVRFYPDREGGYGLAVHRRADVLLVGLQIRTDTLTHAGAAASGPSAELAAQCDTPAKGAAKRARTRRRSPKKAGAGPGDGPKDQPGSSLRGQKPDTHAADNTVPDRTHAPALISEGAAGSGPHIPSAGDNLNAGPLHDSGPEDDGTNAAHEGRVLEFPDPYTGTYASPGWFCNYYASHAGASSPYGCATPAHMFAPQNPGGMTPMGTDPYSSMAAALQAAFMASLQQSGGMVLPTTPYGMGAGAAQVSLSPLGGFNTFMPAEHQVTPTPLGHESIDPGVVNSAWSPLQGYGPTANQRRDPTSPRLWSPRRRGGRHSGNRGGTTGSSPGSGSASGRKSTLSRMAAADVAESDASPNEESDTVGDLQAQARATRAAIEAAGEDSDNINKTGVAVDAENVDPAAGTAISAASIPAATAIEKGKSAFSRSTGTRTPLGQLQPTDLGSAQ